MKTINEITLYELMSEDLDVWVSKARNFGFNLEIDDDNGDELVREKALHPIAADSFANFCRRYLHAYDKASASGVA